MTADGPGDRVERHSPEAAFSLLADETRMAVLEALAETPNEPVSFSTLRERVGVRDSGQFNYHLGKLVDAFVRKTDEGYELTFAGRQVVGALLAGTYTATASVDPIDIDDACPQCGREGLAASYADERVLVECGDCGEFRNEYPFPPGTVEQFDREDLPAAFDGWLWTTFGRITAGFCSNCSGRIDGRLVREDDAPGGVVPVYDCGRCGHRATMTLPFLLSYHPAAVGFLYDHGFDVSASPSWQLPDLDHFTVEVTGTDPLAATVEVTLDDEVLSATVDETASVTGVERRSA